MKNSISVLVAAGLVLGLSTHELPAQDKAAVERLDKKADAVNVAAKKPGKLKAAFQTVSTETGVPLAQVEKLHKDHPDAGPAGIMLACVIADETKKSPDHYLQSRLSGKSWGAIAHDNKVPVEKLTDRLDHLANYLASAPDKADNSKGSKDKK